MKNFLFAAAALGGGRELRGTLAIFAVVTLIATMFFYVLRFTVMALCWMLRAIYVGVRNASRRGAANPGTY